MNWHKTLNIPVTYQVGLPTKDFIMAQPKNSCIVIDDSFDQALQSPVVDHLFRVMSGKLCISVILMSQNTFSKGKFSRDIRNSCNFLALFRNCADTRINSNIARMVGLSHAYEAAKIDLDGKMFPVMFLDLSQKGQLSPYRLYTDLFSKNQIAFSTTGMKGYIINANDFENLFKVLIGPGNTFEAEENENKVTEAPREIETEGNAVEETSRTSETQKTEPQGEFKNKSEKDKNIDSRPRRPTIRTRRNQEAFNRWRKRSHFNLSKLKKHS